MYKAFQIIEYFTQFRKNADDHSFRIRVVLIFNYKVFLLCSVITLSVYLLLVKIDGITSKTFHLVPSYFFAVKHFVCTTEFCFALHFEMQLILDIFFMPNLSLYLLNYRVYQKGACNLLAIFLFKH